MTAPRKPQDHLPAKTEPAEPEKPAGWELLKPFDQVPVWEQTELLSIVQPLMSARDGESGEVSIDLADFDFRIIGDLARRLQEYAVDRDAYLAFVSGPGALDRAMALGMAYATQLGESERSASS